MNLERLVNSLSSSANEQRDPEQAQNSPLQVVEALSSHIPSGLAGGLAAGGIMALLMGSKSTRKLTKKVAKVGGTAVLGGLAYKAYGNWQRNRALGQTRPVTDHDIQLSEQVIPKTVSPATDLESAMIKAMIAAAKSDGNFDREEQQKVYSNVESMDLTMPQKAKVFDLMNRDISLDEITLGIETDEHKAEIYLAAYLAIAVDDQKERSFLNNLAAALKLPKGFSAYLEQQADLGVES